MWKSIPLLIITFLIGMIGVSSIFMFSSDVNANPKWETRSKSNNIKVVYNKENIEGSTNLKEMYEKNLEKPEECFRVNTICPFQEVTFDISMTKTWLVLVIDELSDYEFANTIGRVKNPLDKLEKPEVVIVQETLARRGLLTNLDGTIVSARGFFGPLTRLALLRLAHIKGLAPGYTNYWTDLRDEVNKLLDNYANDDEYIAKNPLPSKSNSEPQVGDPLAEEWKKALYLANLSKDAERVKEGPIPLEGSVDVKVDGFLSVKQEG